MVKSASISSENRSKLAYLRPKWAGGGNTREMSGFDLRARVPYILYVRPRSTCLYLDSCQVSAYKRPPASIEQQTYGHPRHSFFVASHCCHLHHRNPQR